MNPKPICTPIGSCLSRVAFFCTRPGRQHGQRRPDFQRKVQTSAFVSTSAEVCGKQRNKESDYLERWRECDVMGWVPYFSHAQALVWSGNGRRVVWCNPNSLSCVSQSAAHKYVFTPAASRKAWSVDTGVSLDLDCELLVWEPQGSCTVGHNALQRPNSNPSPFIALLHRCTGTVMYLNRSATAWNFPHGLIFQWISAW